MPRPCDASTHNKARAGLLSHSGISMVGPRDALAPREKEAAYIYLSRIRAIAIVSRVI